MVLNQNPKKRQVKNPKCLEIKQHTTNTPISQRRKITMRVLKYFALNDNKNTAYQNCLDAGKAAFRGKFIALSYFIRKEERYKVNDTHFQI